MEVFVTDFGTPILVARHMEESGRKAVEAKPVFELIFHDMMRVEEAVWSSGGRRGGGSWKPLADSTVLKKGFDTILVDTGELQSSLTEDEAPSQIKEVTHDSAELGTTRPWAFTHQYGSKKAHVPKRTFLKFTARDSERWGRMLLEWTTSPFDKGTGVSE